MCGRFTNIWSDIEESLTGRFKFRLLCSVLADITEATGMEAQTHSATACGCYAVLLGGNVPQARCPCLTEPDLTDLARNLLFIIVATYIIGLFSIMDKIAICKVLSAVVQSSERISDRFVCFDDPLTVLRSLILTPSRIY